MLGPFIVGSEGPEYFDMMYTLLGCHCPSPIKGSRSPVYLPTRGTRGTSGWKSPLRILKFGSGNVF